MEKDIVFKVRNLHTNFKVGSYENKIIKGVSFDVYKGHILAIVGESGSGKSVTVNSAVNLLPNNGKVTEGSAILKTENGEFDLIKMKPFGKEMRKIRGKEIGMIFQDPMSSLNPVYTIGDQIIENIREHNKVSKKEAKERAIEILKKLAIPSPEKRIDEYPHEFSGGMKQRVMIAIAMVNDPNLLISDEATTALDVTIQAQIMDLMKEIRDRDNKSIILITHNMGLVAENADDVCVMYMGRIMEYAPIKNIFEHPLHPYTEALLRSVPVPGMSKDKKLETIPGSTPDPKDYVKGCEFFDRCPYHKEKCKDDIPYYDMGNNHKVRCVLVEDRAKGVVHE
ncbi:MAG: ABC transporter ATP-binding protein [Peptoniphilaceae bacterium]|nr:ABC transporter ATP-binding protein [Peptoniphilaceae bacterium]MDY3738508.1 ABC transporter ATP-binding protein [Peptoniphilaceae bacterium]